MHVLHVNTTSHTGGAARAMQRLHSALVEKNHYSQFLVGRSKEADNSDVHIIWNEVSRFRSLGNSVKSRIGNYLEKYIGIHPWSNRTTLRIYDSQFFNGRTLLI